MTDNPQHDVSVPGLTVQPEPLDFAMQAQLGGILEIDPATNCLVMRIQTMLVDTLEIDPATNRVAVQMGTELIDVAWPLGWSVEIRDGRVALIDATGQTAGLLGDEVSIGGGSVDVGSTNVVTCTGREQVFIASGLSHP